MRLALRQPVLYLAPSGNDRQGNPTYADPTPLPGRWEDKMEETIGPQGDNVLSGATIYLSSPVENGGLLFNGGLPQLNLPFDLLADLQDGDLWGQNNFGDPVDGNPSPIVTSGYIQSNNPAFAEAVSAAGVPGASNVSPVSVSFVIKPVSDDGTQQSLVIDIGDGFHNHWALSFHQVSVSGKVAQYSVDGADDNGATFPTTPFTLPANVLSFVNLICDGQNATLFVNGEQTLQIAFPSDPQSLGAMKVAFSFFTTFADNSVPGTFLLYKLSVTNGQKAAVDFRSDRRFREIVNVGSVPALHRSQILYTAMVK